MQSRGNHLTAPVVKLCACVHCISQSRGPRTIMWLASWSFILRSPQSIFRSFILPHHSFAIFVFHSTHLTQNLFSLPCKYYNFRLSSTPRTSERDKNHKSLPLDSSTLVMCGGEKPAQGIPQSITLRIRSPVNYLFMLKLLFPPDSFAVVIHK